jgi:lipopolysaccharide export LptBFGC system permease protein LptF
MRQPLKLFALNLIQFFVIVANTRAYTQGNYFWTAVTDLAFCFLAFTLTKSIAESKTWKDRVGYALGGTLGALLAIAATKVLYGA